MKFGTGSNAERTQKYGWVKVQNDIRTSIYTNTQTSPIFNCVTPVSVSLARQLSTYESTWFVKCLRTQSSIFKVFSSTILSTPL